MKIYALYVQSNTIELDKMLPEKTTFTKKTLNETFTTLCEKYTKKIELKSLLELDKFVGENIYIKGPVRIETMRLLDMNDGYIYEMMYCDLYIQKEMMSSAPRNTFAELITTEKAKVFGNVLLLKSKKIETGKYISAPISTEDISKYLTKKHVPSYIVVKPNGEYKQIECVFGPMKYYGMNCLELNTYASYCESSFCDIPLKFIFLKQSWLKSQIKTDENENEIEVEDKFSLKSVNKIASRLNNMYTIYGDVLICRMFNENAVGDLPMSMFKKMLDLSWGKIVMKDDIISQGNNMSVNKKIPVSEIQKKVEEKKEKKEKLEQLNEPNGIYDTLINSHKKIDAEKLAEYINFQYVCSNCYKLRYKTSQEMESDKDHLKWCVENKLPANEL